MRRIQRKASLIRLVWVGPVAITGAVLAVLIAQQGIVNATSLPPFAVAVMNSHEPMFLTAILVSGAVLVFAACLAWVAEPIQIYRRIAFGALLISFVPNLAVRLFVPSADWRATLALMSLHVVAWAVTVAVLTNVSVCYALAPRDDDEEAASR